MISLAQLVWVVVLHYVVWADATDDDLTEGPSYAFRLVDDARLEAHWTSLQHPTRRYGASMSFLPPPAGTDDASTLDSWIRQGQLILTQGYNYDHPTAKPIWLDDVWVYSLADKSWRKIFPHGAGPGALYKHSTILYSGRGQQEGVATGRRFVVHFGGDDGGHQSNGGATHVWGSFSNAVHLLEVMDSDEGWRWHRVLGNTREKGMGEGPTLPFPAPRQGHSAVHYEGYMYIFGGLSATKTSGIGNDGAEFVELNDLWRLDMEGCIRLTNGGGAELMNPPSLWEQVDVAGETPVPRRNHVAVLGLGGGMYVFGGFSLGRVQGDSTSKNHNDVWGIDLGKEGTVRKRKEWTLLSGSDSTLEKESGPKPRGAAAGGFDPRFGGRIIIADGATCEKGCTCHSDLYSFDITRRTWKLIYSATSGVGTGELQEKAQSWHPVQRHQMAFAPVFPDLLGAFGASQARQEATTSTSTRIPLHLPIFFYFGGESYQPYGYWNDLWILLGGVRVTVEVKVTDGGDSYLTLPGPRPTYSQENIHQFGSNLMVPTIPDADPPTGFWWPRKAQGRGSKGSGWILWTQSWIVVMGVLLILFLLWGTIGPKSHRRFIKVLVSSSLRPLSALGRRKDPGRQV